MGYSWATHGMPWDAHLLPIDYPRNVRGMHMGCLWDAFGVPMGYHEKLMGYSWATHGLRMGQPQDAMG